MINVVNGPNWKFIFILAPVVMVNLFPHFVMGFL